MDYREEFSVGSSIEHIINEDSADANTLNIGNLICLEEYLNNQADRLTFEEKLDIYKKSKYNQVQKFCKDNLDFKIDSIMKRSQKLGEYYYDNIIMSNK